MPSVHCVHCVHCVDCVHCVHCVHILLNYIKHVHFIFVIALNTHTHIYIYTYTHTHYITYWHILCFVNLCDIVLSHPKPCQAHGPLWIHPDSLPWRPDVLTWPQIGQCHKRPHGAPHGAATKWFGSNYECSASGGTLTMLTSPICTWRPVLLEWRCRTTCNTPWQSQPYSTVGHVTSLV